jgi:hypothetical protein
MKGDRQKAVATLAIQDGGSDGQGSRCIELSTKALKPSVKLAVSLTLKASGEKLKVEMTQIVERRPANTVEPPRGSKTVVVK